MMVIGLTGLSRSGKDSVADILVRDYGFEKRAFAGPLKKITRDVDPILGYRPIQFRDFRGADGKPINEGSYVMRLSDLIEGGWTEDEIKASIYGKEYVRFLKKLGTEGIRYWDDDFWINAAMKTLTDPNGKYVFTDCRFPNEAEFIFDMVEYFPQTSPELERTPWSAVTDVWHVTRPGVELGPDAHISEQYAGHMGETVEIMNGGTLEDLKETVDVAMGYISAPRRWMLGIDPAIDYRHFANGNVTYYQGSMDSALHIWTEDNS